MDRHQHQQRHRQRQVHDLHRFAKRPVDAERARDMDKAEIDHRQVERRTHDPSGHRHHDQDRVERGMRQPGETPLPSRDALGLGRDRVDETPGQPQQRHQEDRHANPFVPRVEFKLARTERHVDHADRERERADQQHQRQPVQRLRHETEPLGRIAHQHDASAVVRATIGSHHQVGSFGRLDSS